MGKKKSINLLYLIGCIVIVVGCFLPLSIAGRHIQIEGNSVWGLITSKSDMALWFRIVVLSIFSGAVLGIVFTFVNTGISGLMRLIGMIAVIAGCSIELIKKLTMSDTGKKLAKFGANLFNATPYLGFYCIAAGLVLVIIGFVKGK